MGLKVSKVLQQVSGGDILTKWGWLGNCEKLTKAMNRGYGNQFKEMGPMRGTNTKVNHAKFDEEKTLIGPQLMDMLCAQHPLRLG